MYLNTKTTRARGINLFDLNGGIIPLKTAKSINVGLGLFIRKTSLISKNFGIFWQIGLGYHVFYGNAKTTEPEPFIQRREGFVPSARTGLVYKFNGRCWLNGSINYSRANRLNVFVQERPNAVSLQVGLTFLPRF